MITSNDSKDGNTSENSTNQSSSNSSASTGALIPYYWADMPAKIVNFGTEKLRRRLHTVHVGGQSISILTRTSDTR